MSTPYDAEWLEYDDATRSEVASFVGEPNETTARLTEPSWNSTPYYLSDEGRRVAAALAAAVPAEREPDG